MQNTILNESKSPNRLIEKKKICFVVADFELTCNDFYIFL